MAYGFDKDKNKIEVLEKSQAGEVSNLKTSNKSNIVAAVNEVFQFANDGKAKLAAAIGASITNSSATPPKPSINSTWDQMVTGLLKIKIATLEAKDFTVSVKSEHIKGSSGSGFMTFNWDYTRYTHTTSKIQVPFSNIITVLGNGLGNNTDGSVTYSVPIGPTIALRNGLNWIGNASLSCTQTTENGNKYVQLTVKTIQGQNSAMGSPDPNAAECGKLQYMGFFIIGY